MSLTDAEEDTVNRLAFVMTRCLRHKFEKLIPENRRQPALFTYMSDGWGSTVTSRFPAAVAVGKHVIRNARFRHEFLLQLGLLKVRQSDGRIASAVVLDGAVSLRNGKRSWQCLTAGCEFLPKMRHAGLEGVVSSFYVFDGLLASSLSRRFQVRHRLYYSDLGPLPGAEHALSSLTDWVWCTTCASHNMANAIKCGMRELCSEELLKNVHVVVESLRNGADGLHSHVLQFLVQVLRFTPNRSGSEDDRRSLWMGLNVDMSMLPEFILLDPVWVNGELHVNNIIAGDPKAVDRVAVLLHYALRWARFSETRWVGIGKCSRLYLVSHGGRGLVVGVQSRRNV